MSDAGSDSLVSELRTDWGLNHLLEALTLGEGFHFHLLVCKTPLQARAALALLEEKAGPIVRLRPERHSDPREPVRFEALATEILEPLTTLADGSEAAASRITVVDASESTAQDEPAWRELFRRMNERRNLLAKRLPGPLVLCVPPRLEVAFAHEAPDFWSIRSTSVALRAPDRRTGPLLDTGFLSQERPTLWLETEPDFLREEIAKVRKRIDESPNDSSALAALAVFLSRLGRHELEMGSLDAAASAFGETLQILRHLAAQKPERLDWMSILVGALVDVGEVQEVRGDQDGALSSYEESLGIMRSLLSRGPDRPEWLWSLSLILDRIGDVQRGRGNLEGALPALEESLDVTRRLLFLEPAHPEWLRALSLRLGAGGAARSLLGEPKERVLPLMREAVEVIRRLQELFGEQPEWLREYLEDLQQGLDALEQQDSPPSS